LSLTLVVPALGLCAVVVQASSSCPDFSVFV